MTVEQDTVGNMEIEEVGSNNRMNHQMMDLFRKAIAVQLRPIDSGTGITGMAMEQLCMFAEGQLDALMEGLHRISLLQRRQSVAVADLDMWLRGYHLSPSALYEAMEKSNYIRDTYYKDAKSLETLLPKGDDLANTAFGRVIPSTEQSGTQVEDLDEIDEDDYELVEYQQQAILQLFKTENVSTRLKRSKPNWLPSFPPDHTYKYTPSFNNVINKETVVRKKLVEEGQLSEKALINLMEKFKSVAKQDEEKVVMEKAKEKEVQPVGTKETSDETVPSENEIKNLDRTPDNSEKLFEHSEETKEEALEEDIKDNETSEVKIKELEKLEPTEPVLSEEELAELETRALLYRVENKKAYLIDPIRESLKAGKLKVLYENPTNKLKNFDVEAYAKHRVDLARRRVVDYEYEQLYSKHNPLLKLAKMKDAGADPCEFRKEYRSCVLRSMNRFLSSIPTIKEERKRVHKQAMKDKETRIRNRLADIKEKKLEKERARAKAAKEMEAIERANSYGILPAADTSPSLQTSSSTLPAGAPLLIDPANAMLGPQVPITNTSTSTSTIAEKEKDKIGVDVDPTDINDVNDEDLGLFLESSDEEDERSHHVTFKLADSDDSTTK